MSEFTSGTLCVLLIVYTVVVWGAYHKLFNVYYFDIQKGFFLEILGSFLVAVLLTAVTLKFWYVVASVMFLFALVCVARVPSPIGKMKILVLVIIAIAIVSYVGINGQKKRVVEKENFVATVDYPGLYLKPNHSTNPINFVEADNSYICNNGKTIYLNSYYNLSYTFSDLHIQVFFASNGIIDSRCFEWNLRNTENQPCVYYFVGDDGYLEKEKTITLNKDGSFTMKCEVEGIDFSGVYYLANASDVAEYNQMISGLQR